LRFLRGGEPSDGSFETALANSERALALDANLAEAYAAKGFALFAAVRFDEAAVEFERATRLDAGLFEAHFFHARNCHNQGLRAEAAALFARAAELRPSDFRSPGLLAWECKALGRREQCAAACGLSGELEAEVKAHPDNADALVFGSSILVESGDSARAEDWLARAIILGSDDRFVQYNAALTNAMLGRMDAALDHLEQAFSAPPTFRRRLAAWMKYDDEMMDSLRDHPRFQALLANLDAAARQRPSGPHP
jgi:adenylate cyclase